MSVPAQVRKQSAVVQDLYRQFEGAPNQGDEPGAAMDNDAVAESTPSVENKERSSTDDREYEQKYRTLQGMYNSEVVTVKRENADLKNRIARLEELLSGSQEPQTFETKQFITQQDVEEYGGTIDVIRRAAREENQALQAEIAALKAELRKMTTTVVPTIEKVTKAQSDSQEQVFWDRLSASVPDWQSINNDPQFHEWLLEVDPMTGMSKQVFLEEAQRRLDVNRIANFFKKWKEQTNAPQAQVQISDTRKSQLEQQIAPGKARGGGRQPNNSRVYSSQDIAQFYADVRRGAYRGRDDERARIEADIFAAQAEGRINAT